MGFWFLVSREVFAAVRAGKVGRERLVALLIVAALTGYCVLVGLGLGWSQVTRVDHVELVRVLFGVASAAASAVAGLVALISLAPAIAGEREAKRLDALLTTRATSAEIVLGALGAGLLRAASAAVALGPVLVYLAAVAGIPPLLLSLTCATIAATALWAGAIGVWASAGAATRAQALGSACSLAVGWLVWPYLLLPVFGTYLPRSLAWAVQALVWVVDSSPQGVVGSLLSGALARPGVIHERLLRMIGLEAAGALLLLFWSIARLRHNSRALQDAGAESARRQVLRFAARRRPRRPCGDDPVLWNALEASRPLTNAAHLKRNAARMVWLCVIAAAVAFFAVPAFRELAERGYGAAPESTRMPRENPFARILLECVYGSTSRGPAPGQARLEFNIALRLFSASCAVFFAISLGANAAEGMELERLRGTWLLLLTTPLTGVEILRAKMLAPVVRARGFLAFLIATWLVGALAGAVHPLGLLAEAITFAVVAWFAVASGTSMGEEPFTNESRSAARIPMRPLRILILVPLVLLALILLPLGPAVLAWGALFSYDDVHALIHGGAFPQLADTASARVVAGSWLGGLAFLAILAFCFTTVNLRQFDVKSGRPIRAGRKPGSRMALVDGHEGPCNPPIIQSCESVKVRSSK